MKHSRNIYLGRGVYSLSEAGLYTGLGYRKAWSWFRTSCETEKNPLFDSDYPSISDTYAVSFHDLVDFLIAGQFRMQGVSLQVLRHVYTRLSDTLGIEHPFCYRGLFTDGKKIFHKLANELGDEKLIEILSGQHFMSRVMSPYLRRIDFDESSHLAERWRVAPGVCIDPQINWGKPVINATGVSTSVVAQAFAANSENIDLVCDLFALESVQVENALAFEHALLSGQAA